MIFDVLRYLNDYNIPYRTGGRNIGSDWIGMTCPIQGCKDPSYHGGFNLTTGHYNCWLCGGHSLIKVIMSLERVSYSTAQERIQQYQTTKVRQKEVVGVDPAEHVVFPVGTTEIRPQHRKYLIGRGYDPDEMIEKYKILGTGPVSFLQTDRRKINYQHRIVIPIFTDNIITSFQARDITGESSIKYKPCPKEAEKIPLKHSIYNLDSCYRTAVIMEGVLDVWKWGDGAIATFGIQFTKEQILLLSEYNINKIITMYDAEQIAQIQERKLSQTFSLFGITWINVVLDNKDPGELTTEEVIKLKRKLKL